MARTPWCRLVVLALVLGPVLIACDGDNPSPPNPIAPSPSLPNTPVTGSGPVRGSVLDTAYRPLAGALVEVLDGPQAGTSTNAGPRGEFSFPGTFDYATRFRASMPGHVAATGAVNPRTPEQFRTLAFYLSVSGDSVNMAGEYTLTIVADTACDGLPDDARTRTYAATATPVPGTSTTYFDVAISGPQLLDAYDRSERSAIAVAGDHAVLWFGDSSGPAGPALVERLSPTAYVAFGARTTATVGAPPASIATSFEGFVGYCALHSDTAVPVQGYDYTCAPEKAITHVRCESSRHRLILTRR